MGAQRTGRLTIYLGAAPGVGKTCAMLEQAHRLLADGVDLVVGVVETHGRAGTAALTEDLEIIPRREITYRGTDLTEMDLPAILRRAPAVVLIDELAHTNAPGVEHRKRWEDVHACLEAGIDVLSTLNVQHLESLGDVVSSITGTVQLETVPDEVVRAADEIELVDISPEQLHHRLRAGHVYRPERVDAALGNYFRIGNLTALRELALLWLADRVDEALARYRESKQIRETWEARERVVVAVTGDADSLTMVRRASRIASRASADLVVVHVLRSDGLTTSERHMHEVRSLAANVGASVHTVVGDDIPGTLLEFARGINATQLVIGASRRSRLQRLFAEGIGDAIVRQAGSIDVHLVTTRSVPPRRRTPRPALRRLSAWGAAIAVPAFLTAAFTLFGGSLDFSTLSSLYLVGVLAVSLLGGMWPAAMCALASALALNYCFTPPVHSFTIAEPKNILSLGVMVAVALAVSFLVDFSAGRHQAAVSAARDADLLTVFARAALRSSSLPVLLEKLRDVFGQSVARFVAADGTVVAESCAPDYAQPLATTPDSSVTTSSGSELQLWGRRLSAHDQRLLGTVAEHAAAVVRHEELSRTAAENLALAEADKLRRSLLAAVGHDLRTPLAAAKLSVSSLRSEHVHFGPEETDELLATIEESVDHLGSLVDNLLDSSRLAAGVVHPEMRTVDLDLVAHQAMFAATVGAPDLRHRFAIDTDGLSTWADPGLLERVLANVLANAVRHAPQSQIRLTAARSGAVSGNGVVIDIADDGDGIPDRLRPAAFEPFHRSGDATGSSGIGLGLSVAKGFTEAMGGTISLGDTPGGGTTVTIELPGCPAAADTPVSPARATALQTPAAQEQER